MQIRRRRGILLEALTLDASASFVLREFKLPSFPFRWHYHPELELTLILRGRGIRFVGDSIQDFGPGDLCLLGAHTPHTWFSHPQKGQSVAALVVHFRAESLGADFLKLPEMRRLAALFTRARRGLCLHAAARRMVSRELLHMRRHAHGSWQRLWHLVRALAFSAERGELTPLATATFETSAQEATCRKLNTVCQFVNEHLADMPGEAAVANVLDMSPAAFSRFFRKACGKKFIDYVNELRVSQACRLLLETDQSVTQAAMNCGFNNLSNFNRRFKQQKKLTPSAYRALARTPEQVGRQLGQV